jgi:tRNA U34 2-thiouridine synthase MnmA/TrmU
VEVQDLSQFSPQGEMESQGKYKIVFTEKQRAIASGQIVAFYSGDELWGSGVIV